ASGASNITINVTDTFGKVGQGVILVTVEEVNDLIILDDIPDVTFAEDGFDDRIALDDYVADVETADADIDWTYTGNVEVIVSIDPATRVVTFTATAEWSGMETITFTAEDADGATASDAVTVNVTSVNDAPVLDTIGPLSATENAPFFFDVNASDVDLDTLTFSDDTDLFDIDPSTGVISFTPTYDDSGIYLVTITVSDGQLQDDEQVTLTIENVNRAPTVQITQPEDDALVTENQSIMFYAAGDDPDDDSLTYEWDFGDGTTFGPTADNAAEKTYVGSQDVTVTVTVTDGNLTANDSISLHVFELRYNITNFNSYNDSDFTVSDQAFYRGEPFYVKFDVVDKDNGTKMPGLITQVYMYNNETGQGRIDLDAYDGVADGVTIVDGEPATPNGTYYYHVPNLPLLDDNLGWHVVFVFSYQGNRGGQATLPIIILNNEIVVDNIPDVTFAEDSAGASFDLDDYADDLETDDADIEWSFTGNTFVNISIDPDTHLVSLSAPADWFGVETVTFLADDGDGSVVGDVVVVTVTSVNDPPVLDPIGDLVAIRGVPFFFDVNASDVDNDVLLFDDDTDLFDIDPSTGVISFTPVTEGVFTVTVNVTDGFDYDEETFTFEVVWMDLPPIAYITTPADGALVYQGVPTVFGAFAIDPDGGAIDTYRWGLGDGRVIIASGVNVSVTYEDRGTYTVTLNVSDDEGNVTTDTIVIHVVREPYIVACADGRDNDGDGLVDMADPGCSSPDDASEWNLPPHRGAEHGLKVMSISTYGSTGDVSVLPGDFVTVEVVVENALDEDVDNIRVGFTVPELGVQQKSSQFSLRDGRRETKSLDVFIPWDAAPGEYYTEITVSNGDIRRSLHRWVEVVE
ncbi:PKD domain-containing protein, partial [Candidatus Woesearchaeota archaeon]|nr:PKD domain-containing protein [Candidatus Woesearchaeota archaeon]